MIAVNQDGLGRQADLIFREISNDGDYFKDIWGGLLSGNRFVLVFLNHGEKWCDISINLNMFFLSKNVVQIRDILKH